MDTSFSSFFLQHSPSTTPTSTVSSNRQCLICLKLVKGPSALTETPGWNNEGRSLSFVETLCHFLNHNLGEFKKSPKTKLNFCNGCEDTILKFSELYKKLERIKSEMVVCLEQIKEKGMETKNSANPFTDPIATENHRDLDRRPSECLDGNLRKLRDGLLEKCELIKLIFNYLIVNNLGYPTIQN